MKSTNGNDGSRGQVIAIVALALVALLAGTGFVVDGGIAMSEQRATQNAADERPGMALWCSQTR